MNKFKSKNKTKVIIIMIIIIIFMVLVLNNFLKNTGIKKGNISGNNYIVVEKQPACGDVGDGEHYARGYSIIKKMENDQITYNISGGYEAEELLVKSIKKDNSNRTVITIIENKKSEMALKSWPSCPNIDITFDYKPNEVIIKNTKNIRFDKLN